MTLADLLTAFLAGGGAWLAVRVELRWLRRDVDENRADIKRAHDRIDNLDTRPLFGRR